MAAQRRVGALFEGVSEIWKPPRVGRAFQNSQGEPWQWPVEGKATQEAPVLRALPAPGKSRGLRCSCIAPMHAAAGVGKTAALFGCFF